MIKRTETKSIALRNEIQKGYASILCSIDGETTNEYDIEITEIYLNNNENNKSFEIRIIDQDLIGKTGGIIRGLSRKSNYPK